MNSLGVLVAIKQKEVENYFVLYPEQDKEIIVGKLLTHGYATALKDGKGYKVSTSGTSLLKSLEIKGLEDHHKEQYAKLVELYLSRGLSKSKLGNTKRGLEHYVAFVTETGFSAEVIYDTVEEYLDANSREPEFVRQLSLLIHKSPNAYSTRFNLSDSKLYSLIKDRGI